jgi:RNA polymerase sigma factor (sigma-70 family)
MTEHEEQIRHLASAIERLPETAQLVLALHYDEGLSLGAVGAVLDLTEGEVRELLEDALVWLVVSVAV